MKPFPWSTTTGQRYVRRLSRSRTIYVVVLLSVLSALIFYSTTSSQRGGDALKPPAFFSSSSRDRCAGRYVYMYDLPPRFNADLARDCSRISTTIDMCKYIVNDGFGPSITDGGGGGWLPESGAYATDQYMLELIFHARMRRYECLTADPAAAAAVYVPFYADFDVAIHIDDGDLSVRDALPRDLADWLVRRPEWRAMGGRDHFMVAGRCTWDFLRDPNGPGYGNAFMHFPAIRNMTVLAFEASPWRGNDFGVPYPSHFHPSSDAQVVAWQRRMRRRRPWLWCFAGGSRPDFRKTGRGQIIEQCGRSSRCALLGKAPAMGESPVPGRAMRLLESAEFCVQPRGDSYTRKSIFDSILAGCIPVFLHPISAYVQYTWYLPRDYRSYSVFIPEGDIIGRNASIEAALRKIPPEEVARMREQVIRLIPTVMYREPAAKGMKLKDAFDIAVDQVIHRVAKRRRAAVDDSVERYDSWKYDLLDEDDGQKNNTTTTIGPHEFDPYMT